MALREYSHQQPFELVGKLEENDLVIRVHMRHDIPVELSLIVGDLLNNARSALDLMIVSVARSVASESGRSLSAGEESSLSFPITCTERDFERAARKLERYLSEDTIRRLRIVQPWAMAAAQLTHQGHEVTSNDLVVLMSLDLLNRLRRLNNLDKHRQLLAATWFPGSVTHGGETSIEPIDADPEDHDRAAVEKNDIDPEILARIAASIEEEDTRPGAYDFYFAEGGELHDGAEIGRYRRHDRGQMPTDLIPKGSLRLVLWEPELTEYFRAAPSAQRTVREIINDVESICNFVEPTGPSLPPGQRYS
jgi:hypothetical protein